MFERLVSPEHGIQITHHILIQCIVFVIIVVVCQDLYGILDCFFSLVETPSDILEL